MTTDSSANFWSGLASVTDADIPLLRAAFEIARDEYPELDFTAYDRQLDHYAHALAARLPDNPTPSEQLSALNRYLFHELGFAGNDDDYYDPRNSYMNDVFDRRLGIPISLAIVQIELARRAGVPLEGVSFPGHFLVRLPVEEGLLVLDPYHKGRSIDADELRLRAQAHLGGADVDDHVLASILAPASHRSIIARMLRNLKGVYTESETWDKALRCADRLVKLDTGATVDLRDRGMLYLRIGHVAAARADLERYLAALPNADDAATIRDALIETGLSRTRLN